MKKLGTPIGAAPGRANEKVGFEAVGVPPLLRRAGGLVGVVAGFFVLPLPLGFPVGPLLGCLPALPPLWLEGRCVVLGPVGRGGGACFWVVVWELLAVVVVVVVVAGEGVALGGGSAGVNEVVDEVIDETVGNRQFTPGSCPAARGLRQGGRGSAPEAVGIAARPMTITAALAAATGILSFLRPNTVVYLLPPIGVRVSCSPLWGGDAKSTLLTEIGLCNDEPSLVGGFRRRAAGTGGEWGDFARIRFPIGAVAWTL